MIVNHFKSKGSGADDGTGQGNANPDRVAQAQALVAFADTMQTALRAPTRCSSPATSTPTPRRTRCRCCTTPATPTSARRRRRTSTPTSSTARSARSTTCSPTARRSAQVTGATSGTSTRSSRSPTSTAGTTTTRPTSTPPTLPLQRPRPAARRVRRAAPPGRHDHDRLGGPGRGRRAGHQADRHRARHLRLPARSTPARCVLDGGTVLGTGQVSDGTATVSCRRSTHRSRTSP